LLNSQKKEIPFLEATKENLSKKLTAIKEEIKILDKGKSENLTLNKIKLESLLNIIGEKEKKLLTLKQETKDLKTYLYKKSVKFVESLKKDKKFNYIHFSNTLQFILTKLKASKEEDLELETKIKALNEVFFTESKQYSTFKEESTITINEINKEIESLKQVKESLEKSILLQSQIFVESYFKNPRIEEEIKNKSETLPNEFIHIEEQFQRQINFLSKNYNDTEDASINFLQMAGESKPMLFTPAFLKIASDFYNDILRSYKEKKHVLEYCYSHIDLAFQLYCNILQSKTSVTPELHNLIKEQFVKIENVCETLNQFKSYKPYFLKEIKLFKK